MIPHPRRCIDPLDPAQAETVYAAALRILEETGIAVLCEESRNLLEAAGARARAERTLIAPAIVERAVAEAPRRFMLHARNPERSVELGAEALLVSPGYGSPTVADASGKRREATLSDFDAFALCCGRWRSRVRFSSTRTSPFSDQWTAPRAHVPLSRWHGACSETYRRARS